MLVPICFIAYCLAKCNMTKIKKEVSEQRLFPGYSIHQNDRLFFNTVDSDFRQKLLRQLFWIYFDSVC